MENPDFADMYHYDEAGNQTKLGGAGIQPAYDAENRLSTYTVTGATRQVYDYDGEGRRVRHQQQIYGSGSWHTQASTIYVYDAQGRLAAEYDTLPESTPPCTTCYLTADPLGSTRLMTDENGDALLNSGQPWNPQSWNRYAYVDNNPLRYADPLGLYKWSQNCDEGSDDVCRANRERFRTALENVKKSTAELDPGSKERKQLEKVIKRIGEEGKGNVTIGFGDAGSTAAGPNLGLARGTNITLNFGAVDEVRQQHQLNPAESAALDAGLVAHEGEHVGWGVPLLPFLGMSRESTAYRTESFTYQGLHNTDRPTRLWNESWLGVDRQLLEQRRENAIREVLNPRRQQPNPVEEQR